MDKILLSLFSYLNISRYKNQSQSLNFLNSQFSISWIKVEKKWKLIII